MTDDEYNQLKQCIIESLWEWQRQHDKKNKELDKEYERKELEEKLRELNDS